MKIQVIMVMVILCGGAVNADLGRQELIVNGDFQLPFIPDRQGQVDVPEWFSNRDDFRCAMDTKLNRASIPGPAENQVLELNAGGTPWATGTVRQYISLLNWRYNDVFFLRFNASESAVDADNEGKQIRVELRSADEEQLLWSATVDLDGTHTGDDDAEWGDWTDDQTFEFQIDASAFTDVAEGTDLALLFEAQPTPSSDRNRSWLDNVSLIHAPITAAHSPAPAFGQVLVGEVVEGNVQVQLSWNTGLDPDNLEQINPDILEHYVFVSQDQNVSNDPNLYLEAAVPLDAETPQIGQATLDGLNFDGLYYWRVDEVIGFTEGDPNVIVGPTWKFETLAAVPLITDQPVSMAVEPGDTASFTVGVFSATDVIYQWYQSADAQITPQDDVAIGFPSPSPTLTVQNVQRDDEGYYYCKATNDGGDTYSNVAKLGVKRKVAHWTLDLADFVDGQYLDSSGEQRHAEPNSVPDVSAFVDGVDPSKTQQGLDLAAAPLAAAFAGAQPPAEFTEELTVSVWLKWAGVNNSWQGIISKRQDGDEPVADWFWQITGDGEEIRLNSWATGVVRMDVPPPPVNEWVHMAFTADTNGGVLYRNGAAELTEPGFVTALTDAPLLIGALSEVSGQVNNPFHGVIDDIQIFNYAKTGTAVADLYYQVSEIPVCANPPMYDVAGGGPDGNEPDCRVNLVDFAVFASNWLNCGLYPQELCD